MTSSLARQGLFLRLLRASLFAGALYDLVLAALLVLAPETAERLLGVPRPGEDFYLWLLAVLLAMIAAYYLLAAFDPFSYGGNVLVAIAGRGVAGATLALAAAETGYGGLWVLAACDLFFAGLHAAFWWPVRR